MLGWAVICECNCGFVIVVIGWYGIVRGRGGVRRRINQTNFAVDIELDVQQLFYFLHPIIKLRNGRNGVGCMKRY